MQVPYQFPEPWRVQTREFDEAQTFQHAIITMSGNGYCGLRGALPDWRADRYAGATVADTYDNADGVWKELCNVPNGLYLSTTADGRSLSAEQASTYVHGLDFATGTTYGELVFTDTGEPTGGAAQSSTDVRTGGRDGIRFRWNRFASYENLHLSLQRITIESPVDCRLALRWGLDGEVWSLNGEHFRSAKPSWDGSRAQTRLETTETGLEVAVVSLLAAGFADSKSVKRTVSGRSAWADTEVSCTAGAPLDFWMVTAVYHGNDGPNPVEAAHAALEELAEQGFEEHRRRHEQRWSEMWDSFDVHIDGNDEDQRLLRYNTYHNIIATPAHTDHLPIGARGLSCQAYQGAAFWDQEIFNLPMYVYTRPEIARNILRYRHKTLDGARRKANRLGYRGAFYAWISGDSGDELCPDFFFRDVITGRKIRNHFNDWQIHVSPDISYAVWQYYRATGDRQFLVDSGAEILFEVARFLYSHAFYKKEKDRFEIIRVLGPDEYHENVDNSVFTNVQARYALDRALEVYEMLTDHGHPSDALADIRSRTGLTDAELAGWREMAEKLYIPQPDSESGLIEQFDGYFELEDVTPDKLAERLIDENEYWGWPNGIAYHTQVTKQADVVQLFALHPAPEYGSDIVRRNYEYYEPRTQHRSSLSPGVHALVASRIGNLAEAERYLEHSLTIDLRNTNPPESGGTFIGGIHTAACGIGWQIVVFGFLGLRVEDAWVVIDPRLPSDWDGIRTRLTVRGHQFEVSTDGSVVELVSTSENAEPLEFRSPEGGAHARLAASGRARLEVAGE